MADGSSECTLQPTGGIRTLLIDNYDSYTYNLYQLIAQVNGVAPTVVYNDETTVEQFLARIAAGEFHNIVVSPGPGTPAAPGDVGLCLALIRAAPAVPILGVCLGFQALALAHGGRVAPAPEPVHGRLSAIAHSGHPLFSGIPSGEAYQVVRYHSLVIEEASLPPELEAVAWTAGSAHHALGVDCRNGSAENGAPGSNQRLLMAVAHRELPYFGVQYHPESVATAYGDRLLENYRDLTVAFHGNNLAKNSVSNGVALENGVGSARESENGGAAASENGGAEGLRIAFQEVPGALSIISGGAETLFEALIAARCGLEDSFWLDSASAAQGRGRFSFMGGRGGPLWRRITYRMASSEDQGAPGSLTVEDSSGGATARSVRFWEWLSGEMAGWGRIVNESEASKALPFDFWGGLVGYLGYELKAESGGRAAHVAPTPDAAFFLVDRLIVLDHETGSVFTVAAEHSGEEGAAAWVEATAAAVTRLAAGGGDGNAHAATNGCVNGVPANQPPPFRLREPRKRYLENVGGCMAALHAGDSYELCLTTELRRETAWGTSEAWKLYKTLRTVNPAPYAAWLQFKCDAARGGPLAICCSSPERFLRGDRSRGLEAKPIKGTAPRGTDPASDAANAAALAASEKDRAENLMIVDLLRNDLGRVCEPGSVHVPKLMAIESFATVHQMVSTVRGRRRGDASVAASVAAAFPGGSMTGAPKVRSMAILDSLETGPRGVYSGSLGYFSFGAGAFDLNIVIRTAVVAGGAVRVGAGGAVVVQSDPEGEYDEMRLKAAALLRAVGECDGSDSGVQAEVVED